MQLKSILNPVDFSDFPSVACEYALSLAEYYQARMVALHVAELRKYPFADHAAMKPILRIFRELLMRGANNACENS